MGPDASPNIGRWQRVWRFLCLSKKGQEPRGTQVPLGWWLSKRFWWWPPFLTSVLCVVVLQVGPGPLWNALSAAHRAPSSPTAATPNDGRVTDEGKRSRLGLASASTSIPIAATAVQPMVMGSQRRGRLLVGSRSSSSVARTSPVVRENVVAEGRTAIFAAGTSVVAMATDSAFTSSGWNKTGAPRGIIPRSASTNAGMPSYRSSRARAKPCMMAAST